MASFKVYFCEFTYDISHVVSEFTEIVFKT